MSNHDNAIPVQCCRCRNKHMHDERDEKATASGVITLVCPRCGAKDYYDLTVTYAWCYQGGVIEIGETVPEDDQEGGGAIVFAKGPKSFMHSRLSTVARHGYGAGAGKLLVPGVPESDDPKERLDALIDWVEWCAKDNGRKGSNGVVFGRNIASAINKEVK